MQVAEGVHRLSGGVTNFYVIQDGGRLTLIDAGTPGVPADVLLPGHGEPWSGPIDDAVRLAKAAGRS